MIKDREQKGKVLQFAVANRWFPQLEVEVAPGVSLGERASVVTDVDVLAAAPDQFTGYRVVLFDCKTGARESAVNRALWLLGVMQQLHADQGFCILRTSAIDIDHRLMAGKQGVVVLSEDEFDLYAKVTTASTHRNGSNTEQLALWETYVAIPQRFPKLREGVSFVRTVYWMIEDAPEACRKTLATLRSIQGELDPAQDLHVALFADFCSLFSKALAVVVFHVFKAYLHPSSSRDLSEALLVMLYGGREAYQHRNDLYRLLRSKNGDAAVPDLSLPEWDRFLHLVRQLLDSPLDALRTPLILREVGFSMLANDRKMTFARTLCSESRQGARFALLITDYLARAAHIPPEFGATLEKLLLELQPVK